MRRLDVVYFEAGGGHRSTALALSDAIRAQMRPWHVELVNLQKVIGHLDILRRTTGVYSQDLYNWSLRRGWTEAASRALPAMHGLIRLMHKPMVRELSMFWRLHRPDLVVSVIPHFNRALHESISQELPDAPLVTVLTDLADHPPHFWIERQDQHFICGSDRAVGQALAIGIPREQVWRVSGMAIHPRFYAPMEADRATERVRLGLAPDVPTGLVLFGGYGSAEMLDIVKRLAAARTNVQLILLCGRNQPLADAITECKAPLRRVVRTFTHEIARFMHLSDFFIGKPGPGCVSEALKMKLPVIVERSTRTMVQERYNCDWIEENRAGIVLDSFACIGRAVERMMEPAAYAGFRARIERLENRAVFEIVDILDWIFDERYSTRSAAQLSGREGGSTMFLHTQP